MDVLITGASGRVGTAITDHLGEHDDYRFAALDREAHPDHDTYVADITDRGAIEPAFDGQDAVIHLAGDPSTGASWESVLENNVIGTHNVVEVAAAADIDRVLFASTNHVVGMYWKALEPAISDEPVDLTVDHTDPPRPDSYYAVSKLFGEDLGRYVVERSPDPSIDRFLAMRIGWILDREYDHPFGPAERGVAEGRFSRDSEAYDRRVAMCRALWCSRRDFARLVHQLLQTDATGFDVVYARSGGSRQWLDIDHARERFGFEPVDDADAYDRPPGD